jgi:hypothetical protein
MNVNLFLPASVVSAATLFNVLKHLRLTVPDFAQLRPENLA